MKRKLTADIKERIAEMEKLRELEDAREKRLQETVAGLYAKQEKIGVSGLGPLLKKLRIEPADIKKFFKAQEDEAKRMMEVVTPQLQLTKEEHENIQKKERERLLILRSMGSRGLIPVYHGWENTVWDASSCNCVHTSSTNASSSCTFNIPNNEVNPRAVAFGYEENLLSIAYVGSWCWFSFPPAPRPGTVEVKVDVSFGGCYRLETTNGSASFELDLEAEGYQYPYFPPGEGTLNVLNLSGNTMGRYDGNKILYFRMIVGANDPFFIRVYAKLIARANTAGSSAMGDFATGSGNFIKINYVRVRQPILVDIRDIRRPGNIIETEPPPWW